ncbi:MAG: RNA methyltransferase [Thalassobius sp.]|nr:RNA methyltransferase [Thalassovita sp.]
MNKNKIKFIKSLNQKKYRKKEGLFIVEGEKDVLEVLRSDFEIHSLCYTDKFAPHLEELPDFPNNVLDHTTAKELAKAGSFVTNDSALAIVKDKPEQEAPLPKSLTLILEDVRDPGNLGTIMRIADWYQVTDIICSTKTAEWQNPKVISASKGSFTRVNLYYTDICEYLNKLPKETMIIGTFMYGKSIHEIPFQQPSVVVMGNESAGISDEVSELIKTRVTIPRYGHAESLNVGVATAIVCDNFRRQVK